MKQPKIKTNILRNSGQQPGRVEKVVDNEKQRGILETVAGRVLFSESLILSGFAGNSGRCNGGNRTVRATQPEYECRGDRLWLWQGNTTHCPACAARLRD